MQSIRQLLTPEEDKKCYEARETFYAKLKSEQPDFNWKTEEGEPYLRPQVSIRIHQQADNYFIEFAVNLIKNRKVASENS